MSGVKTLDKRNVPPAAAGEARLWALGRVAVSSGQLHPRPALDGSWWRSKQTTLPRLLCQLPGRRLERRGREKPTDPFGQHLTGPEAAAPGCQRGSLGQNPGGGGWHAGAAAARWTPLTLLLSCSHNVFVIDAMYYVPMCWKIRVISFHVIKKEIHSFPLI